VIAKTHESELFQVFSGVSRHTCDVWRESFARDMAQDASRLMDAAYIASDEGQLHLFCTLNCIGLAKIDSKVSDVDASEVKSDILKFIYIEPMNDSSGEKSFTEVTVTNLSDPAQGKAFPSLLFNFSFCIDGCICFLFPQGKNNF
jgi:hypothetical protein